MKNSDKEESLKDKLERKLKDAYNSEEMSYEFKVNDGTYWQKVRRFKDFEEFIKNKN